jgi:Phage-related protein
VAKVAKPIAFLGGALADLRAFSLPARRQAGYQLDRVQSGLEPDDWKPMASIGAGVFEIRIRAANGAFRVMYVAKFAEAVFVLHCFHKKAQRTSREDISLAAGRYKQLLKERKS